MEVFVLLRVIDVLVVREVKSIFCESTVCNIVIKFADRSKALFMSSEEIITETF